MSTVGVGAVAVGVAAPGLAIGALAVGAGILVVRGVMWCGQKMEENYNNACQEWTNAVEAARQENLARVEVMNPYVMEQLDQICASTVLSEMSENRQATVTRRDEEEVQKTIAQARQMLEQAQSATLKQSDAGRAALIARLQGEIAAGKKVLPSETLAQARQALTGTETELQAALALMETAWTTISQKQAQEAQAELALAQAATRLNSIDVLLREAGTEVNPAYVSRVREMETRLGKARDAQDLSAQHALEMARSIQESARQLLEEVSTASLNAWKQTRSKISIQMGILATLEKLLDEAHTVNLASTQEVDELARTVAAVRQEVNELASGKQLQAQQRLHRLTLQISTLKERVFATVDARLQQTVAENIQQTLADLGFQSLDEAQPVITRGGNTLRVEALISRNASAGQRDDKAVTFDIARDGHITYDFSGYEGGSCQADAEKVFTALRERGIFILDNAAMEELRKVPADVLTLSTLNQERFHPHLEQNKSQAKLAETLKRVLAQMYPQVHQSSVGGHIELEAFQGQLGYRVVLSPEGDVQVHKDAADVSADASDPIVAAAQRTLDQEEQGKTPTTETPRTAQSTTQKRPYIQQRKQQQSGY